MKKLFLVFILLIAGIALADIGPVGRSVQQDAIGNVMSGSQDNWYIFVQNGSGGSLADGTVVVLKTASDDGYSVTTSTTAGAIPHCIIARETAAACADEAMCRCQTYGRNTGVVFDITNGPGGSAGEWAFISESTAGFIEAEVTGSVALTDNPVGVFLDDTTSGASEDVDLFIRLR